MIQHPGSPRALTRSVRALRFALSSIAVLLLIALTGRAHAQTTYNSSGGISVSGSTFYGTNTIHVTDSYTVSNVTLKLNGLNADNTNDGLTYTFITLAYCSTAPTSSCTSARQLMVLGGTGLASSDSYGSGITVNLVDSASQAPGCTTTTVCSAWQNQSYTVKPSSYWENYNFAGSVPTNSELGLPSPYVSNTEKYPQTDGGSSSSSATPNLSDVFGGISSTGYWTLIISDWTGTTGAGYTPPASISSWSLTLTPTVASPTTTTIQTSSTNPSYASSPSNSTTFTATVTSTSTVNEGAVEFFNNGNAISGCTSQPVSSGMATCTTSNVTTQGINPITAKYADTGSLFASSTSNQYNQLVEEHSTNPSGNIWCNNNSFTIPGGTSFGNPGTVYPSVIHVSGYTHTVADVTVTLNSVYGQLDAQHLLVSPTKTYNLDFFDGSWYTGASLLSSGSAVSPVFKDSAGAYPGWGGTPGNGPFDPSDELGSLAADKFPTPTTYAATIDTSIPGVPSTINYGYDDHSPSNGGSSSNTFGAMFNGAPANGDWALYGYQQNDGSSETIGGWCIDLTLNTGNSTATTVSSDHNPQTVGSSANLKATVKSGGTPVSSGGTVTFLDNGITPLADSGSGASSNSQTLASDGTATYATGKAYYSVFNGTNDSKIYEGDHNFTANYGGSGSDDPSYSATFWQRFDNASTITVTDNTHYSYCNAGTILEVPNTLGAFFPNPSNVFVTNLPGTVKTASVTLEGLFTGGATTADTQTMVEGPTGAALDFFSNNTGGSPVSFSSGNYTFADGGTALPTGSEFSPGTYSPNSGGKTNDTFTASSSGFYNLPSSWSYSNGGTSATPFATKFGNTLGNGTWSLFFNVVALDATTGAMNGWCTNFTENAVTPTATVAHSGSGTGGDFVQGESSATVTVDVENDGVNGSPSSLGSGTAGDPAGSNANPLTVSDTLPSGLSFVSGSGTGWSGNCSAIGQTVTCTNDAASVAAGSSYPTLSIAVNVSATAGGSLSNKVTVSKAGFVTTDSNTDTISVMATTATAASSQSTTYATGAQNVGLTATVTSHSNPVNEGTVTFDVYDQSNNLVGSPVTTSTVSGGVFSGTYALPAGTSAGAYSIHATFNGDSNYQLSSDTSATLTVNAFTPTFTWNPPTTIILGTAGTNILNASVNCTSCGTISYTETPSGSSTPVAITTTSGLAAGDYTLTANFNPNTNYGANSATSSLTVSGESVWVVNSGGGAAELAGNGYAITSSVDPGLNTAAAIDATGNLWTVGTGSTLLEEINQVGNKKQAIASGGGLNTPSAIATDGNSELWVTNTGNNSVSLFLNNGSPETPSTGFTDSSLSTPSGVAIDLGGSVWIANQGNNSVTRFLGAAAPVAPLSTAAKNNTTGAKP